MKCCAFGCKNRSESGFLLKRFPADPQKRASWVENMRRTDWQPTPNSRLCEIHFTDDQWEKKREDGSHKLKCSAVPTLFMYNTSNLKEKKPKNRDPWTASSSKQSASEDNYAEEILVTQPAVKNKVVKRQHSLSTLKTIMKNKKILKSEKKILRALKRSSKLSKEKKLMKNIKVEKNDSYATNADDFIFSAKCLIESVDTIEDLSKICRLCLTAITQELSVPIWGDKQNYSKRIFKCCTIACSNNSQFKDFPKRLCINCVTKLDDAYHFRAMCLDNNEKLNETYTNLMANKVRLKKDLELIEDDEFGSQVENISSETPVTKDEQIEETLDESRVNKSEVNESFDLFDKTFEHEILAQENDGEIDENSVDYNDENNQNDDGDDSDNIDEHLEKYISWKQEMGVDDALQTYNCPQCPMVCHSPAELHFHKKSHDKLYSEQESIVNTKKVERNIYCQVEGCNATFLKFDDRIKHTIECHKDSQFTGHKDICPYCAKVISNSFNIRYAMRKHIHLMHSSTSVCPICGKICGSARLTSHIAAIHKRKYEKCSTCGLNMTAKSLYVHMRAVHMKILNYACHLCDKKFYTNYSLQVHIRRHTGNKPFQCSECDRAFAQRHLMNKHILNVHKLGILPKRKSPASSKPKKTKRKLKSSDNTEVFINN